MIPTVSTTAEPRLRRQKVAEARDPRDHVMVTRDGRRLMWRSLGDPSGAPVIALHGTPGSRLKYDAAHDTAQRLGLHLICPDRWGYGGSQAPSRARLGDYHRDLEDLATALAFERFALVGVSGGGPFAAMAAAALGVRVTRLALVSPVGPILGFGDLRLFHALCFGVLPQVPGALAATFAAYRLALRLAPGASAQAAALLAKGPDRQLLREPDVRSALAATFAEGLRPGVAGGVIDLTLFSAGWGGDLSAVRAATRVWIGSEDRNVPMVPALRLAERIPKSQLTLLANQGHFWISRRYGDVLEWLADREA